MAKLFSGPSLSGTDSRPVAAQGAPITFLTVSALVAAFRSLPATSRWFQPAIRPACRDFGGRPIPLRLESMECGAMNLPVHDIPDSSTDQLGARAANRLLTLREAAAFLNVHPNTVRSHVRHGQLPGAQVGRDWRFLEADLIAWIRSRYRNAQATGDGDGPRHFDAVEDSMLPGARQSTERALDALLERPDSARRARAATA